MKKREIEAAITKLSTDIVNLKDGLYDLGCGGRLCVKVCKKCNHETLHQERRGDYYCEDNNLIWIDGYHQCLTCGTRWTYSTEEVAKEVE